MGSLESLGVAPFFALFGVNDVTLSMGLLPWYVLFAIALHRVACRCAGELAGAVAPWLLAVAPPYVQYQQIMPRGDYPETLALGTILLGLVLRVTHESLSADSKRRHLNAIAFVAGLAFWTNWLVFPYFAVAGVYLWLQDRWLPLRPAVVPMLAFFLLGSLPFWIFNIQHGFPTFSFVNGVQTPEGRALALDFALRGAIPILLGFRDLDGRFVYGWLGAVLTAGSALAALVLAIGLHRSWRALLRGRVRDSEPMLALLLLVVAMVAIYSVGTSGPIPRRALSVAHRHVDAGAAGRGGCLVAAPLAGSRRHGPRRIVPALRRTDLRARRRLLEIERAPGRHRPGREARARAAPRRRPLRLCGLREMRPSPRISRAIAWCSPTMAPRTIRSTKWTFAIPR